MILVKLADKIKYELLVWCKSSAYDIVIPNYYMFNDEMDICRIHNDYIFEYEIKVSRSDFKKDFIKGGYLNKHKQIKEGKKANRFYFVVPADLLNKSEIPEYCGLIYYYEQTNCFKIIKTAKLLHKNGAVNYKKIALKLSGRLGNLMHKIKYMLLIRSLNEK